MSGEIRVLAAACFSLWTMTKEASCLSGMVSVVMVSMCAKGGGLLLRTCWKWETAVSLPSTSIKTPPLSLPTKPTRPCSIASPYTNGRKPTPCTTPVTVNRQRVKESSCTRPGDEDCAASGADAFTLTPFGKSIRVQSYLKDINLLRPGQRQRSSLLTCQITCSTLRSSLVTLQVDLIRERVM